MNRAEVLIVADSPFQLTLMSDLLEANNVRTVRRRNAAEALASAQESQPTLVVMDLDLSARESERLVTGLKSQPAANQIPIMIVAEKSQQAMVDQILDRESSRRSLQKPIDTGAFPRKVLREIRRHTTSVARPALDI